MSRMTDNELNSQAYSTLDRIDLGNAGVNDNGSVWAAGPMGVITLPDDLAARVRTLLENGNPTPQPGERWKAVNGRSPFRVQKVGRVWMTGKSQHPAIGEVKVRIEDIRDPRRYRKV